jgi:hypothetical protein
VLNTVNRKKKNPQKSSPPEYIKFSKIVRTRERERSFYVQFVAGFARSPEKRADKYPNPFSPLPGSLSASSPAPSPPPLSQSSSTPINLSGTPGGGDRGGRI